MSSTDKLVIPAYKLGSEREHNEWVRNMRTAAKQYKYLLDIIDEGAIRHAQPPWPRTAPRAVHRAGD